MNKTLLTLTIVSCLATPVAFAKPDSDEKKNPTPVLVGMGSGALAGGVVGGPPGAVIGGIIGLFIGNDHTNQKEIKQLNASLENTQSILNDEQQALFAANHSLAQYKLALKDADETIRQAKLSELATQVQFKTGDATISPVFFKHLDDLANVMQEDETLSLNIQGYADVRGDETYNQSLSEQRAINIKNYLMKNGVDGARLSHAALGESASVGSDYEEHFFDRKVVMTLSSAPETATAKR